MSLLTDDDKALLVLEHLGPAALAGDTMSLYDCFQLALDVAEKEVMAKLASAELPEHVATVERTSSGIGATLTDYLESGTGVYTADQLRQAYAQGAASQLSDEPIGWFVKEHGDVVDLEWNSEMPKYEGNWQPLYTRRQAND